MDRPYRPNKYVLRAPPPIPPRPGGGSVPVPNSATIERAPPLPPRPPTVTENRAPLRQAQTDPPPYDYPCQPTNYQERDGPVELEASIPPGPIAKPAQHSPPPSTAQSHSWASFQTQFFPPPPRRSTSQLLPQPPPPPPSYPSPTSTAINPAPAERLHDGHTPSQSLPYQNAPSAPLLYHEQKQDTALPPTQTSPSPPRKNFQDKIQSPYASSPYVPEQPEHYVSPQPLSQTPRDVDNAANFDAPFTYQHASPPLCTLPLGPVRIAASRHPEVNRRRIETVSSEPLQTTVDNAASYHVQEARFEAKPPSYSPPQETVDNAASYHAQVTQHHTTTAASFSPPQETIDNAASYFSELTISENTTPRLQNNQRRPAPTTISTPRPRIEFNPPHKYILRKCPATAYHLVTPGTWYFHSSVPEFKICTYCYEKHISPTQFSSSFQKWTSPAGGKPFCFFSVPRIKDLLWPRAIQTGDVGDVLDFFGYRLSLSLRQCPGEGKGVKASEGAKWFQLNQRHQGRDEFTQSAQPQGRDVLFACDVAVLFIGKLVLKSDLDTFITKASRHLELPECAKGGTIIDARSRRWYQPRTSGAGFKADDLSICERCYNDFMVHTLFKDNFQLINITSYSNTQRRCLHGLYHSRSVWSEAVESKDFNIWVNAMSKFIKYPPCTLQITPGTSIYQIPGVDNFDICHSCFVGIIEPFGLDRFFLSSGAANSNAPKACDLNPGHPSFAKYAIKLDEAMITATFSLFTTYVSRVNNIPPCPKLDLVKGRKWYGETGCRICQSCYEEVCRDTYLATFFQSTPETPPPTRDGEDGIHCDMYSPRMRSKWQEACITQNLDFFLQFASYRKSVYDRTVPEMRFLLRQAKLNLAMQKMHNTTSTFYNAMDGATAWQFNPHIRYTGGGVGGSFATPYGVTGAQEGQAAWGLMTSTSSMTSRVGQLEGLWHAVE